MVRSLTSLYQVEDLSTFPQHVLAVLHALIPGNAYGYNEVDLERGGTTIVLEPLSLASPDLSEVLDRHIQQHPVVTYLTQTRDGTAHAISDFISRTQFQRLDIYGEMYRHLGAEDQISVTIGMEPRIIGIAVNRDTWEFTDRDRALMNLLRPHLVTAHAYARERTMTRRLLETSGISTVTVRTDGTVTHADDLARAAIHRAFAPWSVTSATLPADLVAWISAQRSALAVNPEATLTPLTIAGTGRRVVIRYIPDPGDDGAVLLVRTQDVDVALSHTVRRYGLSPREAETLSHLMDGASNAQIAQRLTVSLHTVHRHLQNLYAKLGVSSRTAAVAKARDALQTPL